MTLARAYLPHDRLAEPARAHNTVWKLIAGIVVVEYAFAATGPMIWALTGAEFGADGTLTEPSSARTVLVILFGFVTLLIPTFLVTRYLHDRGIATLFGPLAPAIRDFLVVTKALILLNIVLYMLPPYEFGLLENGLGLGTWLALLPLSLMGLLIQTGSEEVFYRGYIQQQLAARFAHPAIWMLVPAFLFAIVHYDPAERGENAGAVVIWAFFFGLAAADLTARTGTLGAAIGFHFANNILSVLGIAWMGTFSGLALYLIPAFEGEIQFSWISLLIDLMLVLIAWLAARMALRI